MVGMAFFDSAVDPKEGIDAGEYAGGKRNRRTTALDWIEQCVTSPLTQLGYTGDGFYRSKDPNNSIKVLKAQEEPLHRLDSTGDYVGKQ